MTRRIRPPKARQRKQVVEKTETHEQLQTRLQRAADHGWRPKEPLPEGISLRILDAQG